MSRRSIPKVMLATLTVLTVVAVALSLSGTAKNHNPFGGPLYAFGGYQIDQRTTEVGAQWKVPVLDPSSPPNSGASTWIAVENSQGQFIQVGTQENFGVFATYSVFWSDVAVGFHPQFLGDANPGNLIKFKMVQTARGWRLSFNDLTDKSSGSMRVPYGRASTFDSAQWIQEDPGIGNNPNDHVTYPTMIAPTFQHLSVNDAAPRLRKRDGFVLETNDGVIEVPTLVHDDQFSLISATGPARQYLRDIFPYDVALYPFQLDIFKMQSPTARVLHKMRSTLTAFVADLRTQTWPAKDKSDVKRVERSVSDYQHLYAHFSVAPSSLNGAELGRLESDNRRDFGYIVKLRYALDLPPS
jgi:hypothetical protein